MWSLSIPTIHTGYSFNPNVQLEHEAIEDNIVENTCNSADYTCILIMTRRETNRRKTYHTVNRAPNASCWEFYLELYSYRCDVIEYVVGVATRHRIRGAFRRCDMETLSACLGLGSGILWSTVSSSKKGPVMYIFYVYLLAAWTMCSIRSRVVRDLIGLNVIPLQWRKARHTVRCHYNAVNFPPKSSKKTLHSPPVRARYGVYFCIQILI